MTIKRVFLVLVLLLVIAAGIWISIKYFSTSKQVYEGVLVFADFANSGRGIA